MIGRVIEGRYEIKSRIARGGMATVYIANDRRLGRDVAVKVMHPHLAEGVDGAAFISRFRREGRAAARLTHPGTVAVFDQGLDGDISFIVEEYVPGTNLRKELKAFGTLPLGKSLAVLEQVLSAVAAAHRKGLIHRDIKPENILIDDNGVIKITDFGLARAVTEVTSTTTGTILGTMAYLAPEVIAAGIVDPRTDVYAIGIMGYEILTGRLPHDAATPIQMAFQQVHQDVPPPSELVPWLPAELSDLVSKFAARDPRQRPANGDRALAEFREVRQHIHDQHPHLLGRRAAPPDDYEEPDTGEIPELGAGALDSGELAAELDEIAAAPAHAPVPVTDRDEIDPDTAQPLESVHLDEIPADAFTPAEGIPIVTPEAIEDPFWLPDEALPKGTGATAAAEHHSSKIAPRAAKHKPRPKHSLAAIASALLLLVGLGSGVWWWLTDGPGAWETVPSNLIALSEPSALSYLAGHNLHPEVIGQYSDVVPAGQVIDIVPAPGTQIRRGETVQLTVSLGTRMVTIPLGLIGAHQPEAETALREAGVRFTPAQRAYSETTPLGRVIGLSETEGAEIPHSTMVTITVSAGPRPVTLPQQVGRPMDEAIQFLHALGLNIVFTEDEPSDSMPAGNILAQDPPNGSVVRRGDTVILTVSSGPPGDYSE